MADFVDFPLDLQSCHLFLTTSDTCHKQIQLIYLQHGTLGEHANQTW